jgi:NADPH2:quinone reductase
MKAVLCRSLDGPEALVMDDIADPVAAPGSVVVRVTAVGLNFFDTLITRGKYQTKPPLPFSPGGEIAGVVEALGAGVTGWAPGDRVMAYLGYGGAREKVAVAAERLIAIPPAVADTVACGLPITYGTALHALRERGTLQPGESVAILGAAGGAGLAAVEVAKMMGARVIAVASSPEKLALCRAHGADEALDYSGDLDLKVALRDLTGGTGVDVVYDCVGGAHAEPAFRALAWKGRFLVVGFASGDIPKLPLNLTLLKGASAIGVFWGEAVRRDPAGHRADMDLALAGAADGRLKPHVHGVFPLGDIQQAIGLLARREASGKVVLAV